MTERRVSYAQNAEDVRVWRAFADRDARAERLTYVDVGANEHRHLSITASLYDLGWRGLLIEADPELAAELRVHRPQDQVVQMAAADGPGELTFFRVPGTGLGTLDETEAGAARSRGFAVESVTVATDSLDAILAAHDVDAVHFMSVDVEGAEALVLQGLSLEGVRPWVLCIEAVLPGTTTPSHDEWEPRLLERGYHHVAFDGVNRWYVADEHAELDAAVSVPFNAIDAGASGWVVADHRDQQRRGERSTLRRAWQRELILHDIRNEVPWAEYERQIDELRTALVALDGSRSVQLTRKVSGKARTILARTRALTERLPAPMRRALVRRRHLRIVEANMRHLTDPAYLGEPPADVVDWILPEGLPAPPPAGLDLPAFTDAGAVQAWLTAEPYDTDLLLERRLDNHGDELGRAMAALRVRLRLADQPASPHWAGGNRVLFDARCLQTPAFGNRGIGRFALAALEGVRESVGDDRVTLLIDRGLEELPATLRGACDLTTDVTEQQVSAFSVLVQPSPMTGSPAPLIPMLHSGAYKLAVVFDFIPLHFPTVYLRHVAARAEYAAAMDALRRYDDFVAISHDTAAELSRLVGAGTPDHPPVVAWPRDVLPAGSPLRPANGAGPIVVMTGDEPRKNTFGALAAIGAATAGGSAPRDVVVVGMAGQETRVHHWSVAAAMYPGETRTAGRLDDEEMHRLLAEASLVVVASFDEGLSLPVIEALRCGTPVVASGIPAHRELLGSGSFLADPRRPRSLAAAIRRHAGKTATQQRQAARLAQHRHLGLEDVLGAKVAQHVKAAVVKPPKAAVHVSGGALDVGIATPWAPQRTGVADFSTTTTIELARLADVTVYTTHDADVAGTLPPDVRIRQAAVDDLLDRGSSHDVLATVLGNSHFHLPFMAVAEQVESVVIAHDTRMVEYYLSLRDRGGVEQLMLRGTGRSRLDPALDDQIDDMRLLENAGFWEIARRSRMLVMHAPSAAARIASETGVTPRLLPFANQRAPHGDVTEELRAAARSRLGFDDGLMADSVHLATFGYVDLRTKMTDAVVEAAAWLSQWGHRVSLHVVGAAPADVATGLADRAREAGIANFAITGFVSDEQFRDYLLAVDVGIQLRISPLLGVSGPLSDLAAYGTPSLASHGLAVDVDTPAYVERLPDDVSPVMVAEAVERLLADPMPLQTREQLRRDYLDAKSPRRYAEALHALLVESV